MNLKIIEAPSRDGTKIRYIFSWGRGRGKRMPTGIYTFSKPKSQIEKNHNKEALLILETKRSQMTLDAQAINSGYIPGHKLKANFVDYYAEYVRSHPTLSRTLPCTLGAFKKFIEKDYRGFISPVDITENFCERFRDYLLVTLKGETPGNYFSKFKRVVKAAKRDGYFRTNPAQEIKAKKHPSQKKDILRNDEYMKLINSISDADIPVKKAAVFCLYTGLRYCDITRLTWDNIKTNTLILKQAKTQQSLEIPIHPTAKRMLGRRKKGKVFKLPTLDGANKTLKAWVRKLGIDKHITWHCLRHSVSVLLQDKGIDSATVAGILGHKSTSFVQKTYQRYNLDSAQLAVDKLPS